MTQDVRMWFQADLEMTKLRRARRVGDDESVLEMKGLERLN